MKNSILMLTLIVGSNVTAQDQVPKAVSDAFSAKFPTVKSVKWEKESDQEWEGEFKMDKKEYSANFSNSGEWLETETEIKSSELPAAVLASIKANFSDHKIEEVEKADKKSGTVYEVLLEKGEHEMEVVFDAAGKVLTNKEHVESSKEVRKDSHEEEHDQNHKQMERTKD